MATAAGSIVHGSVDHLEPVLAGMAAVAVVRLLTFQELWLFATVGVMAGQAPARAHCRFVVGVSGQKLGVAGRAEFLGVALEELGDGTAVRHVTGAAFSVLHGRMQNGLGQHLFVAGATGLSLTTLDEARRRSGMGGMAGEAFSLFGGIVRERALRHRGVAVSAEAVAGLLQDRGHWAGVGGVAGKAVAACGRSVLAFPLQQPVMAGEAEFFPRSRQQLLFRRFVGLVAVEAGAVTEGGML